MQTSVGGAWGQRFPQRAPRGHSPADAVHGGDLFFGSRSSDLDA